MTRDEQRHGCLEAMETAYTIELAKSQSAPTKDPAMKLVGAVFATFITILLGVEARPSFAQAPPPVPALPDIERRTSYSVTSSTCACSVGFALYGDSTDYQNWVEVYLNGARISYNDPLKGWAITSPTGSLATIPRPVTDAVLTFSNVQTGTVQIVGARRPRRTILFQENRGVAARDLNQGVNDIFAQNRETWDKINDVTGRALLSQPGNTVGPLPAPAACAANYLGFDATGLNPICLSATTGTANFNSPPPIGNVIPNTGEFTAVNIAYQNTFAPGVRGPLFIWSNCGATTLAGQNCGLQAWVGNNPTSTPAANHPLTATMVMTNGNNRFILQTLNLVGVLCGPAESCPSDFIDTPINPLEIDVANSATSGWAPANRAFAKTSGTYAKNGVEIYSSPAVGELTNALSVWATTTTGAGWWHTGVELSRVLDIGFRCVANPNFPTVDTGGAFGDSCIRDDSNSASFLKLGNFTHTGAMIDASSGAVFTGGFYRGSLTAATNVLFANTANFSTILTIDSGFSSLQQSLINFSDQGTVKWKSGKQNDNTYVIFNNVTGNSSMIIAANDTATFKNSITYGSASLPATTISFTNNAAAATATLTNAPTAGNPTKWIPINDNGTTRNIPAW